MLKRTLLLVAVTVAIAAVVYRGRDVGPVASSDGLIAICERVVDGDTIKLFGGERVRDIGIDTPETVDPRRPVEPFGHEASAYNRELVEGRRVRIERDVRERDRYGRLLGYVYVHDEATGEELFVNAELLRAGYARVSTVPPDVRHAEEFLALERDAREHRCGLWAIE